MDSARRPPAHGFARPAHVALGLAVLAASGTARVAVRTVRTAYDTAVRRAAPRVVDVLMPPLVESVLPRVIDAIVPHLERSVVPRLVDSSLPLLRGKVLPVVIEDLTDDPLLRELLLEQSRSLVGQAADQLRDATAAADDRVENLFRGLVHRGRGR